MREEKVKGREERENGRARRRKRDGRGKTEAALVVNVPMFNGWVTIMSGEEGNRERKRKEEMKWGKHVGTYMLDITDG